MPDDSREYIDDLRDSVDVDAQVVEQPKDVGPRDGFDSTRSVKVDLDQEGKIAGVQVRPDWQLSVRETELAPAVLDAYQRAVAQRLEAWGEAAERTEASPPRPRPRAELPETLTGQLLDRAEHSQTPIDDTRTLNRLLDVLDELDGAMNESEAELDSMATREVSARSGSGHVTATVSGAGEPVNIEFDLRWLGHAHAFNIGREIMDALEQARRRLAEKIAERPPFARLNALASLADDPAALAEYLGLDDSPHSPGPTR